MFYPQLVAGPIERPQNLLPQFRQEKSFDYVRVTDGLKLMTWGLFKKVVIADRLGAIVDGVYDHPYQHHGLSLILATVFFAFQIFCDFSGYSDIAIGTAQVMGFRLMKNFDRPYRSRSVHEFWSRWHISLSTWFRDYLYIPLGGNRVTVPRWYFNLGVVFLLSGLWHGANWTFVIWGALHGCYLILALMTTTLRAKLVRAVGLTRFPRLHHLLQTVTTFALVCFAWIFFRAKTASEALHIVRSSLADLPADLRALWGHQPLDLGLGAASQVWIGILAVLLMEAVHVLQNRGSLRQLIRAKPAPLRWGIYFASCLLILFLGVFGDRQFIYFQF
jgi:D-alanyl-lipoteichoic acid acyltransferase DltB (MBOAT superfamily)